MTRFWGPLGHPQPESGIYEADPGFSQGQEPILLSCPHPAYLLPFPMTVGVSAQPCSSSTVLFPLPAYICQLLTLLSSSLLGLW